ncbi:hypothetical protein HMPREF9141_2578 [Prevotella multiformis DSM 16608]|uniref:Uncharacterized protein n=1 Tax=Prevotella multiformis DSM 16608 TaxID=888743 RepID=F0FAG1_9BACT|nr:hypothetical protein HMPREF9141_2578 [Prevotella multiformis DSM 16608]
MHCSSDGYKSGSSRPSDERGDREKEVEKRTFDGCGRQSASPVRKSEPFSHRLRFPAVLRCTAGYSA